jgi:hypothetical protein
MILTRWCSACRSHIRKFYFVACVCRLLNSILCLHTWKADAGSSALPPSLAFRRWSSVWCAFRAAAHRCRRPPPYRRCGESNPQRRSPPPAKDCGKSVQTSQLREESALRRRGGCRGREDSGMSKPGALLRVRASVRLMRMQIHAPLRASEEVWAEAGRGSGRRGG